MIKTKLKIGQQVYTHMFNLWGKGTIVALGLHSALIGYNTSTGYYEDAIPYYMIQYHNKHLLKEK